MPKVIVSGRGGCGKSTLTALLAKELAKSDRVLVVDADESNLGLTTMLGMDPPSQTVTELLGGKPVVREKLVDTLRSDSDEDVDYFKGELLADDLPAGCVTRDGALTLTRIGKIEHSMEGCACPMGSVTRSFLKHLSTDDYRWVLVDTEAGVEHFGRGVEEGADLVLIIVDPSHEAVLLAEKAAGLAREAAKAFGVVLAKVDEETGPILTEKIAARGLEVLGSIPYSASLTRANLVGDPLAKTSLDGALDAIIAALERTTEKRAGTRHDMALPPQQQDQVTRPRGGPRRLGDHA